MLLLFVMEPNHSPRESWGSLKFLHAGVHQVKRNSSCSQLGMGRSNSALVKADPP